MYKLTKNKSMKNIHKHDAKVTYELNVKMYIFYVCPYRVEFTQCSTIPMSVRTFNGNNYSKIQHPQQPSPSFSHPDKRPHFGTNSSPPRDTFQTPFHLFPLSLSVI